MSISPIKLVLQRIKSAGLIYDPFVTASIINYEAGHLARNCFYASMVGPDEGEQQLKAGWLANARVELSDLITQARVLAEVYGWDWDDLVSTGEDKLSERIETYKQRGVRPNDTLIASMMQYRDAPQRGTPQADTARVYTPPISKGVIGRRPRDGD